ncbi:MAG: spore maturation protein [Velocimicrobium sp.]
MKVLIYLSDYIIPFVIFYIVAFGVLQKVDVYDEFVNGAKDGLKTVVGILPTLIGLMVAVGVLRASGALDFIANILSPFMQYVHFPSELIPLVTVKMFSSSAATGLLLDVYKSHGPDSYLGTLASIMMSCSETIFYTMSVYFMTAKVKKTRYTLIGALLATLVGVIASVVLTGWMI